METERPLKILEPDRAVDQGDLNVLLIDLGNVARTIERMTDEEAQKFRAKLKPEVRKSLEHLFGQKEKDASQAPAELNNLAA